MYIYTNVYMQTYVVQVNRYNNILVYNNYIRLAAALRCKDSTLFYRYKLYLSQRNITVVLYLQKYISYIYVNIENLSILRYIALHCFTLLCIALYCLSAIYRYIYSFFWFMFFLITCSYLYSLMTHFFCFTCLYMSNCKLEGKS